MARKTNKTDHVLNLIANGESENEELSENIADGEQPAASRRKRTAHDTPPGIQIMDDPSSPADPLSMLIHDSLDKEISLEENTAAAISALEEDMISDILADKKDALPEESIVVPSVDEGILEVSKIQMPEPEPPAPAVTESIPEPEPEISADDFKFVNVMDIVVEDRLTEFIERFRVCQCNRCRLDTKALAMSNLPSKYIVTLESSITPLMSFYKNKYSINIITELTKACLAVLENPRHS